MLHQFRQRLTTILHQTLIHFTAVNQTLTEMLHLFITRSKRHRQPFIPRQFLKFPIRRSRVRVYIRNLNPII
ncbi:hypothetical protein HanIR_Chr03g0122031 [Helianthus annuus]|nr:hypothetical protein HanIR_Chr03g0122031 [Helianthus annuus]